MDHAVHAVEGVGRDVPDVGHHQLDPVAEGGQRALPPVEAVEDPDVVAALQKPLDEDAADVTGASGDQNLAAAGRAGGKAVAAAVRLEAA